mmetsp:Transcript_43514/g.70022  ORF Transcript_43514/g.70022 Transcript_43514/m.70022 type:complete len:157 (-) Transcript_43514:88-558(-)
MSSVALSIPVAEGMAARGSGHIIHINSVQGKLGLPSRAAYAASKHASIGFFDSLRAEVADFGIRVTAVLPGYINTNLSKNAITASGAQYNKTDPSTAKGMNASTVAERILKNAHARDEIIIAPAYVKFAIALRNIIPSVYFNSMIKRARRNRKPSP